MFYLSLRYLPWVAPTLGIFANAYATASGAIGSAWMLVKYFHDFLAPEDLGQ